MTDLLAQVTPLTRGIIWLRKSEASRNDYYKWIDYLLDGLLTATMNAEHETSSNLLVGKNFGKDFFVLTSKNDIKQQEVQSYFDLLKELGSEEDILVVDESHSFENFKKLVPKKFQNQFRSIS